MHNRRRILFWMEVGTVAFAILLAGACKPMSMPNSNANANTNANANSRASNDNTNTSSDNTGPSINTREPEKYSATLVLSMETQGGDKGIGIPPFFLQAAPNA